MNGILLVLFSWRFRQHNHRAGKAGTEVEVEMNNVDADFDSALGAWDVKVRSKPL